ncbi:FGFR2 [Branchiostoma lanceolatum]|nr:FGFR2 [Branchiostoma lanceolatum]
MRGTLAVSVCLLVCMKNCRPALGCTHQLTGTRGHISRPDVTSDHCEWVITTDPDRIILINFDRGYFQRGSDGCGTDVLTFYDGDSSNSRIFDTFCRTDSGPLAPYHLSTASTGHQLRVVFERRQVPFWLNDDLQLTFTTRKTEDEPLFDDNTFVPQTAVDFDPNTVAEFVRFNIDWLIFDENWVWPYGYRTDGDILQFYIAIQEDVLDFDLTPDMDFECAPTHSGIEAFSQPFINNNDRNFPLEDWPWIPFYIYQPWEQNVAVMKYIYRNVKVGAGNSELNEIECVINGQVFRTKVIVKACPIGRFGRFCAERCQCFNGASCHSFNGACRCAPGWRGRNCTTVHPEVRISPSGRELDDLRYGLELQLNCTAYNFRAADITWYLNDAAVNGSLLNETSHINSSFLHIDSLLPEFEGHVTCVAVSDSGDQYADEVDIRIAGCADNYWGETCDRVCNCTGLETCNRTLGCVCQGEGCPDPEGSQPLLLAISLSAAGLILLLLGAIFLLHRHNNRLRVGNIDDPEVFQLGQNLKAVMPLAAGSSSASIDMELLKEREIDRSRLQLGQLLGEGAFGHVVKATLAEPEEGNKVVAVKKLKDDEDPQARQAFLRETCIMLLCGRHDNVIGLKGICFRDGPLQLVLEYAEHGSLLHLLWTLRAESKLNRAVLVNKRHIFENMMVEVCCGLEHLASMKLVHRDIAARNILICGKGTAKIADFGLARDMYALGYHRQDGGTDLLPLKWMAPEGLKNEARFTHKSDVWSFGVLLWEVAQLGRTPYPGMEGADRIYDALQNHFRLPRPQLCTEERYQLMLRCWKFNEKTRPDATTVRQQLEADPNGFFYFHAPVAAIEAPVTPINFENKYFQRGTENCTGDVLTFRDGGSSNSRIVDTFCGVQDGAFTPYHLSTASTGHQLHVVFERGHAVYGSKEFNLTFTTREIDDEPFFDDSTFVPQTVEGFDDHTAGNFVRLKLFEWWTYGEIYFAPTAYRTDLKTAAGGDILEFYFGIDDNQLEFDLTPDTVYSCDPTHPETMAFGQLFLQHDRAFPLDDWPWIPLYSFRHLKEDIAVMKYTYLNVKVGAENAALNEIKCVTNGQVFRTQVIVKACPIGRFGRFCAERCQCFNGASCHSFNGACRCAPGWRGRNCTTVHPEVRISPSATELTDLRYGQELQLNCTAYNIDVTDITWSISDAAVNPGLLTKTDNKTSSVLHINCLLPEYEGHVTCVALSTSGDQYTNEVVIRIAGCEDGYYGEFCDRVCDCTGLETCNRTLGCVCQGEGCPDSTDSQSPLLAISLSAAGLSLLLLGAIFLLHRHNNRLRVGSIDDPEVFRLGQNLKAVMPLAAGSTSASIDMELLKERDIHRSRLQLGQLLGEGAFGCVVKATLTEPDRDDVVVAVKKLKDIDPSDDEDPQARQALLRETCIMLLCGNHDNVIGLKGICFRDGPLQLVLEYAEHGSLLHLLWTLRAESKLNRTVLVNKRHIFENMMVEVCCGLEHLGSRRLVHRDIAARNILICGKGTAKIADFGLARDMYAVGYHRQDRGTDLLPLKWMAPEGLKNEARFTHKSDVWSFGVLLWEVAQLGRTPYPGMEGADRIYDALQNHFRLPRPQLCTEERYQLMLQCWKFNEKTRPDATTVRKQLEADPDGFFYFNVPVAAIEAPVTPV